MNKPSSQNAICVLLVEDSDSDAELTRLAFRTLSRPVQLHHVTDGVHCMDFLHRRGEYRDAPRPDLVLLDINMPRMNGFEVMKRIQADPSLRDLRIVALTSSSAEQDRLRMERLRCEAYLVKPVEFSQFAAMVSTTINHFFPAPVFSQR